MFPWYEGYLAEEVAMESISRFKGSLDAEDVEQSSPGTTASGHGMGETPHCQLAGGPTEEEQVNWTSSQSEPEGEEDLTVYHASSGGKGYALADRAEQLEGEEEYPPCKRPEA